MSTTIRVMQLPNELEVGSILAKRLKMMIEHMADYIRGEVLNVDLNQLPKKTFEMTWLKDGKMLQMVIESVVSRALIGGNIQHESDFALLLWERGKPERKARMLSGVQIVDHQISAIDGALTVTFRFHGLLHGQMYDQLAQSIEQAASQLRGSQ